MELQAVAASRRSIRQYEEGVSLTQEQVQEIVAFAQNAPSWKNSQTHRYYGAVTPEAVAEIRSALPEFNCKNTKNAAGYIVTTFVTKRAGFNPDGTPNNELGDQWGAYDLGLANAYLILKAREMGFDTLIMGIRDSEKLRAVCGIADTEQVVSVIAVGKRAIEPNMPPRKALDEILKIK